MANSVDPQDDSDKSATENESRSEPSALKGCDVVSVAKVPWVQGAGTAGEPPVAELDSMLFDGDLDQVPFADVDLNSTEFVEQVIPSADRSNSRSTSQKSSGNTLESRPPASPHRTGPPPIRSRQLVLIGAGATHLQILRWWQLNPIRRVNLTLVSAFDHVVHPGMLPGTLAGLYRPEETRIDLMKFCQQCGVRLIVDRANSLDPNTREIEFAHQPMLRFDLASINIGSVPSAEPLWQSHRMMISTKPSSTFLDRFRARFQELVDQWNRAPGPEMLQVAVVGAGVNGVELAFSLEQCRFDLELPIDVRVIDGNSEILPSFSRATVRRVKRLFKKRGIETSLGSRVVDVDDSGPSTLVLENGQMIRADLVVWATDAAPPMSLAGFRLSKSAQGFLKTRPTFQSIDEVPVFIVGDVADFAGQTISNAETSAVRRASALHENLVRWFDDQPLAEYRPKKSAMTILGCGDQTAILSYHGFCFYGGWVWWLKDTIDRRWIRQFQVS